MLIQTLSEQVQAGMTRAHLPVRQGSHTESSTSPYPALQNPHPAPSSLISIGSATTRRKTEEEKTKKKKSRSLPPFPCSIPREEFAPKSIDLLCPVHQSVDRSARVSGLPRGSDLVFASSGEEPEEEMNGAGGSHQQQQQRLRQQQQQQALLMQQALQQQQQYQSGVLAAATAAAMTQVVPPDPRFLICCFVCALGGITARRSAY
jgi:nucleolysin TIA-1/TIAR